MGKATFKATYTFQYRFPCEHCGAISPWKAAAFQQQQEYKGAFLEGQGPMLVAQKEFEQKFLETEVPGRRQKVEEGDYTQPVGGLDSRCPTCKKHQSWEKVSGVLGFFIAAVVLALLAFLAWKMFGSAAAAGKGKAQLAWLITGGASGLGGLIFLVGGISEAIRHSAIKRDTAGQSVQNKPEFQWPE